MAAVAPLPAIVAFLKADSAVAALVGTKVFGGELPQREAANMPQDCIVVTHVGGTPAPGIGSSHVPITRSRFDFKCYGASILSAQTLYAAVNDALKQTYRVVFNDTFIYNAVMEGGPRSEREGDTQWPFTFATYQIAVSDYTTV